MEIYIGLILRDMLHLKHTRITRISQDDVKELFTGRDHMSNK